MNFLRRKKAQEVQEVKPKPRPEKKGCEIEIKNTKTGKKITWRGDCKPEHLRAFAKDNGIDMEG